jgi:hypothetical protein
MLIDIILCVPSPSPSVLLLVMLIELGSCYM